MEAMTFAWNALTKDFAAHSLPIAVAMFVAFLPGQLIGFTYGLLASVVAEYVEPSFVGILGGLVQATSAFVGVFIGSYIGGGVTAFSLKVARGQPVSFGDVFSGGKYFGRMLIGTIGLYIAAAIGFVLCIVPGYIVMLGLCMFAFLIVDQGMAGIDALKKSWELTNGHKMNLFVFGLLGFLVILAGALACGIGIFLVSYPMLTIGGAYVYDKLKGGAGGPVPATGPSY